MRVADMSETDQEIMFLVNKKSKELVLEELKDALHKGLVAIEFKKKSTGEVKETFGTLKHDYIKESIGEQADRKVPVKKPKNEDIVTYFDPEPQQFRSLDINNLIDFDPEPGT